MGHAHMRYWLQVPIVPGRLAVPESVAAGTSRTNRQVARVIVKLVTYDYNPKSRITTTATVWTGKAERGFGSGEFEVDIPQSALRHLLGENAKVVVEPE